MTNCENNSLQISLIPQSELLLEKPNILNSSVQEETKEQITKESNNKDILSLPRKKMGRPSTILNSNIAKKENKESRINIQLGAQRMAQIWLDKHSKWLEKKIIECKKDFKRIAKHFSRDFNFSITPSFLKLKSRTLENLSKEKKGERYTI